MICNARKKFRRLVADLEVVPTANRRCLESRTAVCLAEISWTEAVNMQDSKHEWIAELLLWHCKYDIGRNELDFLSWCRLNYSFFWPPYQEMALFDEETVGDLTSRLGSDCQQVSRVIGNDLNLICRNVVQGTGALIALFIISWPLALSMVLICASLATVLFFYGRFQKWVAKLTQDFAARANEVSQETFSLIRTIQDMAREIVGCKLATKRGIWILEFNLQLLLPFYQGRQLQKLIGRIEFVDVSFHYPSRLMDKLYTYVPGKKYTKENFVGKFAERCGLRKFGLGLPAALIFYKTLPRKFHHLTLKVDGGGMDDGPDQDPMVPSSRAIVVPGLLRFDVTKGRIGSGHNQYFVVPFGGKTTRFRGLRVIITVYPAVPFGGKPSAISVLVPTVVRCTYDVSTIVIHKYSFAGDRCIHYDLLEMFVEGSFTSVSYPPFTNLRWFADCTYLQGMGLLLSFAVLPSQGMGLLLSFAVFPSQSIGKLHPGISPVWEKYRGAGPSHHATRACMVGVLRHRGRTNFLPTKVEQSEGAEEACEQKENYLRRKAVGGAKSGSHAGAEEAMLAISTPLAKYRSRTTTKGEKERARKSGNERKRPKAAFPMLFNDARSCVVGEMSRTCVRRAAAESSMIVFTSVNIHYIFQIRIRSLFITMAKNFQKKLTLGLVFIDVEQFPAVEHIDLSIQPNKVLAIVGRSGSGKSTIANLLLRLYEPTNGAILVDGIPIEDLDIKWLREKIGFVGQEPPLFRMDVTSNIRYGCTRETTQEEVEWAAKQAFAHEFILSLPDGYSTLVDNALLSGGQKQRIAIARAILRDPTILILDEATSALDAESEHYIKELLLSDRNVSGEKRTVIVIAHRLSTIQAADTIVVMDVGRIVEVGNHKQLLHKNGLYASLARRQSDAFV
ncbi:ABC transporter B family member 26, chloroplastic [Dendrobium catenatum]|uniref:ABC transporter B family member 26, chloroplastic n=1 Tax=Dendrobium catenatum TaxID=906689 RepID=A0A2I0VBX8_9ASPA|nr:ABC transporter B family member 26, chloroplastic [Dendrobium catenatum]